MNKVSVKIDGVEYQIVGEKDEAEIVKVAQYIDGELDKINKAAPSLNKVAKAVLTSVNIADKYFSSSKEARELREELDSLKSSKCKTDVELEKEFDSVLEKLGESENKVAELLAKLEELEATPIQVVEGVSDEESEKRIKSLELRLKDMENKVAVAESMATEFQNKAYNLQLNYEELKKENKGK